jgi:NAD(P)-dependent dehydrogenase (short-subunit alcohol dehydrogenase family)/putative sterol carrier protein
VNNIDFQGKTVVITGAGGGLGAAHARAFAARGANLVINDAGVSRDGSGGSASMAEAMAESLRAAGAQAIPHTGSVASKDDAEGLIALALEHFGSVDVLINNAGILRDRTLVKMSDKEFDDVVAVHLRGTFLCSRAACQHMKERAAQGKPGAAIVNTTSTSGLLGNFGQSNYGAAKAGIAGFTRTVAQEMIRYGVRVNCIAPIASTRMTADLAEVPASFKPEQVSPLVVFLASEAAQSITGRSFGAAGGALHEYYIETSQGMDLGMDAVWTPEQIAGSFDKITRRKAADSGAGKSNQVEQLDRLLMVQLPVAFSSEAAADFSTLIHFRADSDAWTAAVRNGKLEIQRGLAGQASASVEADPETMLAIMSGKGDPIAAFASGKLRLTSPEHVMRFQQCFRR